MVEEFAALPPKPENSDAISFGSGEFSVTPLSKRKSQEDREDHDTSLEDQHSVSKKPSQKKIKGE
ncbi:unnamed protein product [Eruca vesicaria subsp. sativa]|uniref:Uncharacterized protein n=1 Tax=Eruca vesicaria subsp. sativa TaxID=29727 RepID=A0ABC8LC19_ERUVS|nr:unnamed protein product [Eruca vesicaria subsp. sativa]